MFRYQGPEEFININDAGVAATPAPKNKVFAGKATVPLFYVLFGRWIL